MKQSSKTHNGSIDPVIEKGVNRLVEITMQALEALPRTERKRRLAAFQRSVNDAVASSLAKRAKRSESALELVSDRK